MIVTRVIYLTVTKCNGQPDNCSLRSTWRWDSDDEFAVQVTFNDSRTVAWTFDRQVVLDGVKDFGGIKDFSDFTIERAGDSCRISMRSPDGTAVMEAPRGELKAFAKEMRGALPAPRLPSDEQLAETLTNWARERDDPLRGLW